MSKKPAAKGKGKGGEDVDSVPAFASEETRSYLPFTLEPSPLQGGVAGVPSPHDAPHTAAVNITLDDNCCFNGVAVPAPQLPPMPLEVSGEEAFGLTDTDLAYLKSFEQHVNAAGLTVLPLTTALRVAHEAAGTKSGEGAEGTKEDLKFSIVQPDPEYIAVSEVAALHHMITIASAAAADLTPADPAAKGKGGKPDKSSGKPADTKGSRGKPDSSSSSLDVGAEVPVSKAQIIEKTPKEVARIVYRPPLSPHDQGIDNPSWLAHLSILAESPGPKPQGFGAITSHPQVPAPLLDALQMFVSLMHIIANPAVANSIATSEGFPFLWEAITPLPQLSATVEGTDQMVYFYAVQMFWAGAWRRVIVDDRMPYIEVAQDCASKSFVPLFPVSSDVRELWPALLWKAWFVLTACPPCPVADATAASPWFGKSLARHVQGLGGAINDASLFMYALCAVLSAHCPELSAIDFNALHHQYSGSTNAEVARDWMFAREERLVAWARQIEEAEVNKKRAIAAERRRRLEVGEFSSSINAVGASSATSSAIASAITASLTDDVIAAALGPPPPPLVPPSFPMVLPLYSVASKSGDTCNPSLLIIGRCTTGTRGEPVPVQSCTATLVRTDYPLSNFDNETHYLVHGDYYAVVALRDTHAGLQKPSHELHFTDAGTGHIEAQLTLHAAAGTSGYHSSSLLGVPGPMAAFALDRSAVSLQLEVQESMDVADHDSKLTAGAGRHALEDDVADYLAEEDKKSTVSLQQPLPASMESEQCISTDRWAFLVVGRRLIRHEGSWSVQFVPAVTELHTKATQEVFRATLVEAGSKLLKLCATVESVQASGAQVVFETQEMAIIAACGSRDATIAPALAMLSDEAKSLLHRAIAAAKHPLVNVCLPDERISALQKLVADDSLIPRPSTRRWSWDDPVAQDDLWISAGAAMGVIGNWLVTHNVQTCHHSNPLQRAGEPDRFRVVSSMVTWHSHWIQALWDERKLSEQMLVSEIVGSGIGAELTSAPSWYKSASQSLTSTLSHLLPVIQRPHSAPAEPAAGKAAAKKPDLKGKVAALSEVRPSDANGDIKAARLSSYVVPTDLQQEGCLFIPRSLSSVDGHVYASGMCELLVTAVPDVVADSTVLATDFVVTVERDDRYTAFLPRVEVSDVERIQPASSYADRVLLGATSSGRVFCQVLHVKWDEPVLADDRCTVAVGAVYRVRVESASGIAVSIQRLPSCAATSATWMTRVPQGLILHEYAGSSNADLKLKSWSNSQIIAQRMLSTRAIADSRKTSVMFASTFSSALERRLPFILSHGLVFGSYQKVLSRCCGISSFTMSGTTRQLEHASILATLPLQQSLLPPGLMSTLKQQGDVVAKLGGSGGARVEMASEQSLASQPQSKPPKDPKSKSTTAESDVQRFKYPHPVIVSGQLLSASLGQFDAFTVSPSREVQGVDIVSAAAENVALSRMERRRLWTGTMPERSLLPSQDDALSSWLVLTSSSQKPETFLMTIFAFPSTSHAEDPLRVQPDPAILPATALLDTACSEDVCSFFPVPGVALHISLAHSVLVPGTFVHKETAQLSFSWIMEEVAKSQAVDVSSLQLVPTLFPTVNKTLLQLCGGRTPEKVPQPTPSGRPSSASSAAPVKPAVLLLLQTDVLDPGTAEAHIRISGGNDVVELDPAVTAAIHQQIQNSRLHFDGYHCSNDRSPASHAFSAIGRRHVPPVPWIPEVAKGAADGVNPGSPKSSAARPSSPSRQAQQQSATEEPAWVQSTESLMRSYDYVRHAARNACSQATTAVMNNCELWADLTVTIPVNAIARRLYDEGKVVSTGRVDCTVNLPVAFRMAQVDNSVCQQPPTGTVLVPRADVGDAYFADKIVASIAAGKATWESLGKLTDDGPNAASKFHSTACFAGFALPFVLAKSMLLPKLVAASRDKPVSMPDKSDAKAVAKSDKKPPVAAAPAGATTSTASALNDLMAALHPTAPKAFADIVSVCSSLPWLQPVSNTGNAAQGSPEKVLTWRVWKDDHGSRLGTAVRTAWANPSAFTDLQPATATSPRGSKDTKGKVAIVEEGFEYPPCPPHVLSLVAAYLEAHGARRSSEAPPADAESKSKPKAKQPEEALESKNDPFGLLQKSRQEIGCLLRQAHLAGLQTIDTTITLAAEADALHTGDFAPLLPPSVFPLAVSDLPDADSATKALKPDETRQRRRAAARALAQSRTVITSEQGLVANAGRTTLPALDTHATLLAPMAPHALGAEDTCTISGATAHALMGLDIMNAVPSEYSPRSTLSSEDKAPRERGKSVSSSKMNEDAANFSVSFPFDSAVAAANHAAHEAIRTTSMLPAQARLGNESSVSIAMLNAAVYDAAFAAAVRREHVERTKLVKAAHDNLLLALDAVLVGQLEKHDVPARAKARSEQAEHIIGAVKLAADAASAGAAAKEPTSPSV